MIVVRKFVHLLDQSDQDFQEELDLMKMREEVITLIRSNQQLENDLNLMDIKIGLLVKNKITLQVWPGLPPSSEQRVGSSLVHQGVWGLTMSNRECGVQPWPTGSVGSNLVHQGVWAPTLSNRECGG